MLWMYQAMDHEEILGAIDQKAIMIRSDPTLLSYPAPLTETALFTDPTDPTLLSYLSLLTDC